MKNNEIVKSFIYNPIIFLALFYFFFGTLIYSTWNYSDNAISSLLDIITATNYLIIFVFLALYFYTGLIYRKLNTPYIIMRFETRKDYIKYTINTTLKTISIIYLCYIIIMLISLSILGMNNFDIETVGYSTNLSFLVNGLVKLYFYIVLVQLIAITTFIYFKNSTFAAIFNCGVYLVIYILKYFTNNVGFIINALNPHIYLSNVETYFNSWQSNILASIIFIIFYLTLIILIIKNVIKNKDFLEK